MMAMERQTPSRQHLEALYDLINELLYDLINELLPDKDVYYTDEELESLSNTEGIEII